jgi:hypothetical protein
MDFHIILHILRTIFGSCFPLWRGIVLVVKRVWAPLNGSYSDILELARAPDECPAKCMENIIVNFGTYTYRI